MSINSIYIGNYALSNGARVINSTNIYPNLELWKKIDKEKKYEDIYNRYAHIKIDLVEEETSFSLVQEDYMEIKLNYKDLEKLKIKYLISNKEIEIPNDYSDKFNLVNRHDNIYIYKYLYNKI